MRLEGLSFWTQPNRHGGAGQMPASASSNEWRGDRTAAGAHGNAHWRACSLAPAAAPGRQTTWRGRCLSTGRWTAPAGSIGEGDGACICQLLCGVACNRAASATADHPRVRSTAQCQQNTQGQPLISACTCRAGATMPKMRRRPWPLLGKLWVLSRAENLRRHCARVWLVSQSWPLLDKL